MDEIKQNKNTNTVTLYASREVYLCILLSR